MRQPAPDEEGVRRVFVAVFPSQEILESLTTLQERLEPAISGLRWLEPRNLHFTLRFFGDRSREEVDRAGKVLTEVVGMMESFDLELRGLGVFPGWKRPRVLWVGTDSGSDRLKTLARSLDRGFQNVGLGKADRPFAPHLTLGRWRSAPASDLADARGVCDAVDRVGNFLVREAGVIQSTRSPQGSRYTVLHTMSLKTRGL